MNLLINHQNHERHTFEQRHKAMQFLLTLSDATLCDTDGVIVARMERGVLTRCDADGFPLPRLGQRSALPSSRGFHVA